MAQSKLTQLTTDPWESLDDLKNIYLRKFRVPKVIGTEGRNIHNFIRNYKVLYFIESSVTDKNETKNKNIYGNFGCGTTIADSFNAILASMFGVMEELCNLSKTYSASMRTFNFSNHLSFQANLSLPRHNASCVVILLY